MFYTIKHESVLQQVQRFYCVASAAMHCFYRPLNMIHLIQFWLFDLLVKL